MVNFCVISSMKRLWVILTLLFVFSCEDKKNTDSNKTDSPCTDEIIAGKIPDGFPCSNKAIIDVFNSMNFETTHPINAKNYGCIIVSNLEHPIQNGNNSARFEVRKGDCSGNSGFDDCANDRSRHEINESIPNITHIGKLIEYTTFIYIPSDKFCKPKGENITILSQINVFDTNIFNSLIYLMIGNNDRLYLQTHKQFSWTPDLNVTITDEPYDKWIKIKYLINTETSINGKIEVFVDDELILTQSKSTLPSENAQIGLRFGIYNAFISKAETEFTRQVLYFDNVSKSIQ